MFSQLNCHDVKNVKILNIIDGGCYIYKVETIGIVCQTLRMFLCENKWICIYVIGKPGLNRGGGGYIQSHCIATFCHVGVPWKTNTCASDEPSDEPSAEPSDEPSASADNITDSEDVSAGDDDETVVTEDGIATNKSTHNVEIKISQQNKSTDDKHIE